MCAALVTMCSCVTAVEALFVDEIDGVRAGAVEKHLLVVFVIVLRLQLFLLHDRSYFRWNVNLPSLQFI